MVDRAAIARVAATQVALVVAALPGGRQCQDGGVRSGTFTPGGRTSTVGSRDDATSDSAVGPEVPVDPNRPGELWAERWWVYR